MTNHPLLKKTRTIPSRQRSGAWHRLCFGEFPRLKYDDQDLRIKSYHANFKKAYRVLESFCFVVVAGRNPNRGTTKRVPRLGSPLSNKPSRLRALRRPRGWKLSQAN